MAVLALFWIIIWIVWTGLLIIFSWASTNEQTISNNDYLQLQDLINANSWAVITWTWTSTWETE